MKDFLKIWEGLLARWRNDIFRFCREGCGLEPTPDQEAALKVAQDEAIRPPGFKVKRKIAIKSGQGCGKTAVSGIIATWWTLRWPGAVTYVTSPAMHQAKQAWLAEYRRTMAKAHPLLKRFINTTKTTVQFGRSNPDWAIKLVTASKVEAISGRHAKHQYIIIEEATGIETDIWETLIGTQTDEDNLIMAISNPTAINTDFGRCFTHNRPLWHCFTFNAERSPLVSKRHIQEIVEAYGKDSDYYRIRVLGEFPEKDPDVVIDPAWVERSWDVDPGYAAEVGNFEKAFGVDFARMGGDENVVCQRLGYAAIHIWTKRRCEPHEALYHAWERQRDMGWKSEQCWFVIDGTGIGQSMIEPASKGGRNVYVFHNGGVASERMYANKITEAYFQLATLLKEGVVHLPKDDVLLSQLCSRKYDYNKKGQMELESKKAYIKRMGQSPDRADAVVMAFYRNTIVRGMVSPLDVHRKVGPEYDHGAE